MSEIKKKILLDYDEDSYYVCIFCKANARTKQALRMHSLYYHTDPPKIITLDKISYYVDREREKMKDMERQGKYNKNWIVEDDPNLHDELVKANIIKDEFEIESNQIITPNIFARAIITALKLRDYLMNYNDALEIAGNILNFFGFEDEIIENVLDRDDREVLYFLEDLDFVEFRINSETVIKEILTKTVWEICTVQLKRKRIIELANQEMEKSKEIEVSKIYEKLPKEAWIR